MGRLCGRSTRVGDGVVAGAGAGVHAAGAPGRVREEERAGEPAGVEELARLVLGAEQRRGEQRVAQHGQGEGRDGGVHGGAVGLGAAEVQHQHHRDERDVQERVGQREGRARDAAGGAGLGGARGVREGKAPGEGEQGAADEPGVEAEADPARSGDGALREDEQAHDGGRREAEEGEVGERGLRHGLAEDHLVPAPDRVAAAAHERGEREQQPGRTLPAVDGAGVGETGDGGQQAGGAEPEVAHDLGEFLGAPAEGGADGVPAADHREEELHRQRLAATATTAAGEGPAGQQRRPRGAHRSPSLAGSGAVQSRHRRLRRLRRIGSFVHWPCIARRPPKCPITPQRQTFVAQPLVPDDTPLSSLRDIVSLRSVTNRGVGPTERIRTNAERARRALFRDQHRVVHGLSGGELPELTGHQALGPRLERRAASAHMGCDQDPRSMPERMA